MIEIVETVTAGEGAEKRTVLGERTSAAANKATTAMAASSGPSA